MAGKLSKSFLEWAYYGFTYTISARMFVISGYNAGPEVIMKKRLQELMWNVAGGIAVLLGLIGIVLPAIPGTPFLLLAIICFSRGSRRVFRWLLRYEPLRLSMRRWHKNRAIGRRAKLFATGAMCGSLLMGGILKGWWLVGLLLLLFVPMLWFIWRCPDE